MLDWCDCRYIVLLENFHTLHLQSEILDEYFNTISTPDVSLENKYYLKIQILSGVCINLSINNGKKQI